MMRAMKAQQATRPGLSMLVDGASIATVAVFAAVSAGRAQAPVSEEEIVGSSAWFACKTRFQCVVVQDAYCNGVAVNNQFAIVNQDWTRQQVELASERMACLSSATQNAIPGCREGRCVWPLAIQRRRVNDDR